MTRLTSALCAALLPLAATVVVSTALPAQAGAEPICDGHPATIVGTNGDDELVGTPGDDVIMGLGGADTIQALGGNDVVCGGLGRDDLRGGSGDDLLLGGYRASILSGGAGDDTLYGWFALDVARQSVSGGPGRHDRYVMRFVTVGVANLDGTTGRVNLRRDIARATDGFRTRTMPVEGIEEVELLMRGHWTLVGSGLDEVLLGHSRPGAPVVIHAGGGRDVLRGTRNSDLLDGGRGLDTVLPTTGRDRLVSIERRG
jgi:Ca2+-binding RTX toxin-like protein